MHTCKQIFCCVAFLYLNCFHLSIFFFYLSFLTVGNHVSAGYTHLITNQELQKRQGVLRQHCSSLEACAVVQFVKNHALKFRVCLQCTEERISTLNSASVLLWMAPCIVSNIISVDGCTIWQLFRNGIGYLLCIMCGMRWLLQHSLFTLCCSSCGCLRSQRLHQDQAGRNTEPCSVAFPSWLQNTDTDCMSVT